MSEHTIAFPTVETYYILKSVASQDKPDDYGSVTPKGRMDSGANLMQTFTDFSEWQAELAKYGIDVTKDNFL